MISRCEKFRGNKVEDHVTKTPRESDVIDLGMQPCSQALSPLP